MRNCLSITSVTPPGYTSRSGVEIPAYAESVIWPVRNVIC